MKTINKIVLFAFLSIPICSHAQSISSYSLKESIAYGLSNHPTLAVSKNKVAKSHEAARDALSAYLPQVSAQATWDYNYKLQENVIPAGVFGPTEQRIKFGQKFASSNVIQLDQVIYDQSLLTGLKANRPNTELALLDIEANEEDIIYNVSNAFYSIMIAEEHLSLLSDNKIKIEELLRITEIQKNEGLINTVDVAQVSVNLENIKAQMNVIENNIAVAKNMLKYYMGISQSEEIVLEDKDKYLSNEDPYNSVNASSTFDYSKTIAYRQQQIALELWDINIKRIKYNALPKIGLYARYGANGFDNDKPLGAYDPLLDFGSIGLKLTWGIFTGFKRDAMYKTAKLDRDIALRNLNINNQLMELAYENAKSQWLSRKTNITTNKNNIEQAKRVYEIAQIRYKEGVATLAQLINAEMSMREANNNYTQALLDYYKAELDLHKANGTLKSYYANL